MLTIVELTDECLAIAEKEAKRRQEYNESRGLLGRNRAPAKGEKALRMHLLGCIGEVAVAKLLGLDRHLFKSETAVPGSSDLPGNIEVKTRSNHKYDLLVQLDDNPEKIFVLATYEGGRRVIVHGWIKGCDGMMARRVREFVRNRPCYAIPQSALLPLSHLSAPSSEVESSTKPVRCWLTKKRHPSGEEEVVLVIDDEETLKLLGWSNGTRLKCTSIQEFSQCTVRKLDERIQTLSDNDR